MQPEPLTLCPPPQAGPGRALEGPEKEGHPPGQGRGGGGEPAKPATPPDLPCQHSGNSTEHPPEVRPGYRPEDQAIQVLTAYHRKSAYVIRHEVEAFVARWGIERCGFLTLTFADHVTAKREAARRFNSLLTHVLRQRYAQGIVMWERMKSGRWHVHVLVVLGQDIRTGIDWAEIKAGVYRSAGAALRAEWAFWRVTARRYRFGRTELLPIRTTGQAVAGYISKYLAKHIDHRLAEDRGARVLAFWGYSKRDPETGETLRGVRRRASTVMAWSGEKSRQWRAQVADFAAALRVSDFTKLSTIAGPRWAWWLMNNAGAFRRDAHEVGETHDLGLAGVAGRRGAEVETGRKAEGVGARPYVLRPRSHGLFVRNGRTGSRDGRAVCPGGAASGLHGDGGGGVCRAGLGSPRAQLVETRESRTPLPKRSGDSAPGESVKVEASLWTHYLDGFEDALASATKGAGGMGSARSGRARPGEAHLSPLVERGPSPPERAGRDPSRRVWPD